MIVITYENMKLEDIYLMVDYYNLIVANAAAVCYNVVWLLLFFEFQHYIVLLCTSSKGLSHYQIFSCNISAHKQKNYYFEGDVQKFLPAPLSLTAFLGL